MMIIIIVIIVSTIFIQLEQKTNSMRAEKYVKLVTIIIKKYLKIYCGMVNRRNKFFRCQYKTKK